VNERPEARPDSKLLEPVYLIALSTLPLFISLDIPQGPPAVVTDERTNGKFRNPKTPKLGRFYCSFTIRVNRWINLSADGRRLDG
jgi:hypothetical protein